MDEVKTWEGKLNSPRGHVPMSSMVGLKAQMSYSAHYVQDVAPQYDFAL